MIEPIKTKDLIKVLSTTESDKPIDQDLILDALKEALEKSYIRQIDAPDAQVEAVIDSKYVRLFHKLLVVEQDSGYEELEITLEEARKIDPEIKVGDYLPVEIDIRSLSRATVLQIKNILKQKVRESEKQAVYDEYIDQKGEMVIGFVQTVEDKFTIVDIGKTLALMPKSQQIPNEYYKEGDKIRVLITDVKKDTKGAQVLVSRADAMFVKRLFEKEVPEIFQGIVEIKAIAREAGDRTKIAVYSKNEDVDPIGACIGPKGQRVQSIIEELQGEKIDIFLWSDNIGELIKNSLSPAEVIAYYYAEDKKGIVAVVEDDKLSLAIGKKGKNARLAVKLVGRKIDIKTRTQVEEEGIDYVAKTEEFVKEYEEQLKEKEAAKFRELQEEMLRRREELEKQESESYDQMVESVFEDEEPVKAPVIEEEEEESEPEEVKEEKPVVKAEKKEEPKPAPRKTSSKVDLESLRSNNEYVSKFEEIAAGSKPVKEEPKKKRSKKRDDEDRKLRPNELNKDREYEFKVEYSDEELEEIEAYEEELEANSWIEDDDINFDEYDAYYDEED